MHPNLIPVPCPDVAAVQRLAEQMFQAAGNDPVDEKPVYSQTKQEALDHAEKSRNEIIESGSLRLIEHKDGLYNVVLTLDVYHEKPIWHLSLSSVQLTRGSGPQEIPEPIANFIMEGFFGDKGWPMKKEGYWSVVKHYGMDRSRT